MDEIRRNIRRISRATDIFAQRTLEGSELTPNELTAIRSVVFHKGLTQMGLSERLGGIDKAAVTRLVKSLEEKGYITRISDESDKRAKLVYPTDKAYQLSLGVIGAENRFYRWLFSDLTPSQLESFSEYLSSVAQKAFREIKNDFKNTAPKEEEDK